MLHVFNYLVEFVKWIFNFFFLSVQGLRPSVPAEAPTMIFASPTKVVSEAGATVEYMGANRVQEFQRIFQVSTGECVFFKSLLFGLTPGTVSQVLIQKKSSERGLRVQLYRSLQRRFISVRRRLVFISLSVLNGLLLPLSVFITQEAAREIMKETQKFSGAITHANGNHLD